MSEASEDDMTTKLDCLRDELLTLLNQQGIERRMTRTQFMSLVQDVCERILEDPP